MTSNKVYIFGFAAAFIALTLQGQAMTNENEVDHAAAEQEKKDIEKDWLMREVMRQHGSGTGSTLAQGHDVGNVQRPQTMGETMVVTQFNCPTELPGNASDGDRSFKKEFQDEGITYKNNHLFAPRSDWSLYGVDIIGPDKKPLCIYMSIDQNGPAHMIADQKDDRVLKNCTVSGEKKGVPRLNRKSWPTDGYYPPATITCR